jgi:hypothetical protein
MNVLDTVTAITEMRSSPESGRLLKTLAGRSGYPPKLSVKADIPARQPSATSRHMQCSKIY